MFILASKSPRRIELLQKLVQDFEVIPANINEDIEVSDSDLLPVELSKLKANAIYSNDNQIVLAADTVVIIDNKVLGKPHSTKEAYDMLKLLSGKKHKVITGYTIKSKNYEVNHSSISYVYFNNLSDEEINNYIASGSPFDKAGAYGIQDEEYHLISHIEGSYFNVMGLPVEDLKIDLTKMGICQ